MPHVNGQLFCQFPSHRREIRLSDLDFAAWKFP